VNVLGILGREPEGDVELSGNAAQDLAAVTAAGLRTTPFEDSGRATQELIFSYAPRDNADGGGGGGNVPLPWARESEDQPVPTPQGQLSFEWGETGFDGDPFAGPAGVFGGDLSSSHGGGGGGGGSAALDGGGAGLGGGSA